MGCMHGVAQRGYTMFCIGSHALCKDGCAMVVYTVVYIVVFYRGYTGGMHGACHIRIV